MIKSEDLFADLLDKLIREILFVLLIIVLLSNKNEAIFADKVVLPTPVRPATKIKEEDFNFSLLENTNLFDNCL